MKITFTVRLDAAVCLSESRPPLKRMQIAQNLSLKTNNSQQNGQSGLFLHQAFYTGQSLVVDLDFPVLQTPPKSPVI